MATIRDDIDQSEDLIEAIKLLIESAEAAEYDFGGEQREWHVPRLRRSSALLIGLFPIHSVKALQQTTSPADATQDTGNVIDDE